MIKKFKLTDQAKKDTLDYANAIISKGITDPDHPSGLNGGSIFDRFYCGYLGEWAFNLFLLTNGIKDKVRWDREADGFSDKGDFFFGGKVIDVKNASQPFHVRLMIPLVQFQRCKKDYYVATKMENDVVEIIGYATSKDIENATIGDFGIGITKWIFHTRLKPIEDLVYQDILKKWEIKDGN